MASKVADPIELYRSTSVSLTPLEYFTDATSTINIKSDLTLVVGEQKFYCHRLLLALVSPVFSRMFDGEFREHTAREIILHGKKSETILELLKYIYPQFSGSVNKENIDDFLQIADEYMIENLKKPCHDVLAEQLKSYGYVSLPVEYRPEQRSLKSKNFHASDSALDASQHNETDSHTSRSGAFSSRVRRPESASQPTKSHSSHLKFSDKSASSSQSNPRYISFLNQTQIPTFYDKEKQKVSFDAADIKIWINRLRILYQIDRTRQYGDVVEKIIAILQFIPGSIIASSVNVSMETFPIDEQFLNDITRARMSMLEEWSSDGISYREVRLTDMYNIISPTTLASMTESLKISESEKSVQPPAVTIMSDSEQDLHFEEILRHDDVF